MKKELEKMGLEPDTFCFAPYVVTDLDQNGNIYTCYRGKTNLGNWKKRPFDVAWNGPQLARIRGDLFKGFQHKNCRSCYSAEDKNSASPRLHFFHDVVDQYYRDNPEGLKQLVDKIKEDPIVGEYEDIKRAEMRPSSLCNLRCMHCGPHSSTRWIQDLAKDDNVAAYASNGGLLENGSGFLDEEVLEHGNVVEHYKDCLNSESAYQEDIMKLLSHCEHVSFTGGEPLLTPEHPEYLQFIIDSGRSKNMMLEYNTNLNVKNLERFFPYWEQFAFVHIRVSIDTSFDTYNYFRTYGNTDLLQHNLKLMQDWKKVAKTRIRVNATVTYNLFSSLRWKTIMENWTGLDLDFHTSLIIDHPTSIRYMPDELRNIALEEMQWCYDNIHNYHDDKIYKDTYRHHTEQCINYTKGFSNPTDKFPETVSKYIEFCDSTSGNSYKDYFPELEKYM